MDLGYKMVKKNGYWSRDGDSSGLIQASASPDKEHDGEKERTDYPSLYVGDAPEDMEDVAKEGTATIKYKVTSRTVREDEDGKKHCDVQIEIQSFDPEEKRSGTVRPFRADHTAVGRAMAAFMLGK